MTTSPLLAFWGQCKDVFSFFKLVLLFFFYSHYIRPYLPEPALGCQWQLALISTPQPPTLDKKQWQALSSQFLRHVARHKLICHSLLVLMCGWHTAMHANTHPQTKTNAPSIKNRYTNWDTIACQKWGKKAFGKADSLLCLTASIKYPDGGNGRFKDSRISICVATDKLFSSKPVNNSAKMSLYSALDSLLLFQPRYVHAVWLACWEHLSKADGPQWWKSIWSDDVTFVYPLWFNKTSWAERCETHITCQLRKRRKTISAGC